MQLYKQLIILLCFYLREFHSIANYRDFAAQYVRQAERRLKYCMTFHVIGLAPTFGRTARVIFAYSYSVFVQLCKWIHLHSTLATAKRHFIWELFKLLFHFRFDIFVCAILANHRLVSCSCVGRRTGVKRIYLCYSGCACVCVSWLKYKANDVQYCWPSSANCQNNNFESQQIFCCLLVAAWTCMLVTIFECACVCRLCFW